MDQGSMGARWFKRGVDSVLDAQAAEAATRAFEAAKREAELKAAGPAFSPWPKTPRLFRGMTVTEKLDGTNAGVHVVENPDLPGTYSVTAQSRNRIITPGADNAGFAVWVRDNAAALARVLGPGLHFGEWWGRKIGRHYGLDVRRFSLFNTDKHADLSETIGGALVEPVPVLYRGAFSTSAIADVLDFLKENGSLAVPGFMNPEGVCVFHHASRTVLKVTLDSNDAGKWESVS
jgi:hypothetical protein